MKLIAKNLNKKYGDRYVVNDVSLELDKGEIVGLLGPNGAGKTTTFYMLVGLIRSFSGDVMINNTNISSDPMHIRARKGLGYLPQQPSVFTKVSVEDNILTVLETLSFDKEQKNIGVVVPVHFGGLAANSKKIFNISKNRGLNIVEDAAHAFGAKYECGAKVGSCKYSDLSVFSFHQFLSTRVLTLSSGSTSSSTQGRPRVLMVTMV